MFRVTNWLRVGQVGVQKQHKSPYQKSKRYAGLQFKHAHLRLQPWYYCPLCAEPKQQGTCCRREDCRRLKP